MFASSKHQKSPTSINIYTYILKIHILRRIREKSFKVKIRKCVKLRQCPFSISH